MRPMRDWILNRWFYRFMWVIAILTGAFAAELTRYLWCLSVFLLAILSNYLKL